MSAATIPMTGDVAKLIGPAARHVENRSLLLDKFVFHKRWPVVEEQTRRGRDFVKWDEASRWSFMRIADGAEQILRKEAADKRRKAGGRDVQPENRNRYNAEAEIADSLATVKWDSKELAALRARHTRHFLGLFRKAYGDRAAVTIGQVEGRLAINLADSLIQNAGICLDRLFGLPYIPGSAVKGVCRHAALAELKLATGAERKSLAALARAVFGCSKQDADFQPDPSDPSHPSDQKGAVSFLPAYPVNEARIVVDLTNVHYPDYYRSGRVEDLSKEHPQPNPFPAVEIGARFAFCLVLNGMDQRPEILAAAKRWLEFALTVRGLGAKTAAGYGWFSLKPEVLEKLLAESATEEKRHKEREEASTLEASSELMDRFRSLKEQELVATLNKYALGPEYWPKDSTLIHELSLFEFIKTEAGKLAETKNGKKAMTFLAQKLNRPFP
ncbi:MAG: type III-B CRISPR module RAMP protein Cmr6 [Chthoniobacterales bacterium]|nr:type III-B CRISPR module RAMP protein Cmr6 [Chthoniobacterales bacterium]